MTGGNNKNKEAECRVRMMETQRLFGLLGKWKKGY